MRQKERDEYWETTNRSLYSKLRKKKLAKSRNGIRCSYCQYHRNENYEGKWYGGKEIDGKKNVRFPSWKLATKNRKQWMSKPRTYRIVSEIWKPYWYGGLTQGKWIEVKF